MSQPLEGREILDALRARGLLTDDQLRLTMAEAQRSHVRAEEALIVSGAFPEADLLKWLAAHHRTQFVSTEKLSRANVDRQLLRMVPRQLAQRLGVCPILWKQRMGTLAVVAPAATAALEEQVRASSGAQRVQVLIARPAAVRAAIAKHYDGDARAFVPLVGERARKKKRASAAETGSFGALGDANSIPLDGFEDIDDFGFGGGAQGFGGGAQGFAGGATPAFGAGAGFGASPDFAAPAAKPAPAPPPGPPPPSPEPTPLVISAPDIMAGLAIGGTASSPGEARAPSSHPPEAMASEREAYLDMLHVMVTLIERDRKELKDHSVEVARLTGELCDRLGIRGEARHGIVIAAYIHDIGKSGNYHLTALNVSRYDGHRAQAQRSYGTPGRLFGGTKIPKVTLETLDHLYERWDGTGFPGKLAGKDIPLGARIVAIAETFADLTGHDKNPYRRVLQPAEAVNAVQGFAETVFDPSLCRLLKELAMGDLQKKLLADRRTVLLVDPDPDETTVLDIRLSSAGYDVQVARDARDALQRVREADIDAIVSEVELDGGSGFDLLRQIQGTGRPCPVLFVTTRGDRESVNQGFALGAADYLMKPASPEVVVAKVRQLLSKGAGRGIQGSLSEMALPDVVQVLGNGRKTGKLTVRSRAGSGEIHFREGHVWDSSFGSHRGEEAFYALMRIREGEFALDPTLSPGARLIEAPTETLLLEAMRRIDEG